MAEELSPLARLFADKAVVKADGEPFEPEPWQIAVAESIAAGEGISVASSAEVQARSRAAQREMNDALVEMAKDVPLVVINDVHEPAPRPEGITRTIARIGVRIIDLHRDEHGVWCCQLDGGQGPVRADRKHGSWHVLPHIDGADRRELLPDVAAVLQEIVGPIEDAERKTREAAELEAKKARTKTTAPTTKETQA